MGREKKKNSLLYQKAQYAPERISRKSGGKKVIKEMTTEERKCPNQKGPQDPTTAMTTIVTGCVGTTPNTDTY